MADVLKRLCGPALLTGSAATQYTAPATSGQKVVIRQIHVFNNDASTAYNFTLSIGTDAAGTRLWDAFPILAKESLDWNGNIVMNASEIIQAFASTTNKLNLTISGVESV